MGGPAHPGQERLTARGLTRPADRPPPAKDREHPRMIKVEAPDTGHLERKLRALAKAIDKGAERGVKVGVSELADDMRKNAPVLTGALVKGIQERVQGLKGSAVSTADHSEYVEHGTSSAPAQPFAQPAANRARKRYPQTMRDEVKRELKHL